MSDYIPAVRTYLATFADVKALLGSSTLWDTYIFQYEPYVNIERTSKAMIVLDHDGGWGDPEPCHTYRLPKLRVEIWADSTRDASGNVTKKDGRGKIWSIFDVLDPKLHRVNGSVMLSSTVRAFSLKRLFDPFVSQVDETDGVFKGVVDYAVGLG